MSRDLLENPQNLKDNSREFDTSSAEEGSSPQKSRGLLHVPSRSSSQKNQASPTATGLSGATVGDSRDSLGGRSKESRASIMGRHRNGSASSNRSAVDTAQTATTMSPNTNPQRKKKGGLLSLFCCGVPDDANVVDNEPGDVPSHKVEKLPPRPTTASRRAQTPSEQTAASKTQLQEKDGPQSQNPADSSKAKRASGATQDQSTLAEESKPSTLIGTAPTVTIDPPLTEAANADPAREVAAKDDDRDTAMTDAADATEPPVQPVEVDDLPSLPPAPPMPAVPSPPQDSEVGLVAAPEQPQQEWLLPPIQPHLKGRKCLVLDLDETLVHSSFKVAFPPSCTFVFLLLMFATDTTPSRLHYTC